MNAPERHGIPAEDADAYRAAMENTFAYRGAVWHDAMVELGLALVEPIARVLRR